MQQVFFNAFPNTKAGFIKSTIRFLTQYLTNGTSEHCEIFFQGRCYETIGLNQDGEIIEIKPNAWYTYGMQTHGVLLQEKEERLDYLKKNYKGVLKVYDVPNFDYQALMQDIKRTIAGNLKYGFIDAYISAIDHTFIGKILLKLRKKSTAIFCSGMNLYTLSVCVPHFWSSLKINNINSLKELCKTKSPNEYEVMVKNTGFSCIDEIYCI